MGHPKACKTRLPSPAEGLQRAFRRPLRCLLMCLLKDLEEASRRHFRRPQNDLKASELPLQVV
jgi:hypothetical protein